MMIKVLLPVFIRRGEKYYILAVLLHKCLQWEMKTKTTVLITLNTSTRSLDGSSELAGMFWCFSCSLRSLSFLISCKLCLSEAVSPSESLSRKSKTEVSEELRKPRSLAWITPSLGIHCSSSGLQNNLKAMRLISTTWKLQFKLVFAFFMIFERLFL